MKILVKFFNKAAEGYRGISFEDIDIDERSHDAGSPNCVNVTLIEENGDEHYLGTFFRQDLKRLARAV